MDPFKPDIATLVKLGSIVVHTDEALSSDGHTLDIAAIRPLLRDPVVREWIAAMTKMAMLPVKRKP